MSVYFFTQTKKEFKTMKKILKRLATDFLIFATILIVFPTTAFNAFETQYCTESAEQASYIKKVVNDGSIG